MTKKTYVMRDGKLAEKPKAPQIKLIELSEADTEFLDTRERILRAMEAVFTGAGIRHFRADWRES